LPHGQVEVPAAKYTFDATTNVASGSFVLMGTAGSRLILRSCSDGKLIETPDTAIQRIDLSPPSRHRRATVPEALLGSAPLTLGVGYLC